jgi:hypothetical protein
MDAPFTSTYTVGLPPSTQAEIDGILADLRLAVQKWGKLADKLSTATDAITVAAPLIQGSVKEAADTLKEFKITGPLGIKGGS